MMPVQRYPGPLSFRKQKPFTQADLCTVLGFTSAVMGCFWGSVLLLPLGLVTSVLGSVSYTHLTLPTNSRV